MSHLTADMFPEIMQRLADAPGDEAQYVFVMRSRDEVARFFDGLEMAGPGLTLLEEWLPASETPLAHPESARMHWCGIGRKP
jgi:hypothetical protein